MRTFRNIAFALLALVATAPGLHADGWDFCNLYPQCDCGADGPIFISECLDYEDCAEIQGDFCWDALIECNDHCYDWQSGGGGSGSIWPAVFNCVADLECAVYCECYPLN